MKSGFKYKLYDNGDIYQGEKIIRRIYDTQVLAFLLSPGGYNKAKLDSLLEKTDDEIAEYMKEASKSKSALANAIREFTQHNYVPEEETEHTEVIKCTHIWNKLKETPTYQYFYCRKCLGTAHKSLNDLLEKSELKQMI